jgi:hypothetical protein
MVERRRKETLSSEKLPFAFHLFKNMIYYKTTQYYFKEDKR